MQINLQLFTVFIVKRQKDHRQESRVDPPSFPKLYLFDFARGFSYGFTPDNITPGEEGGGEASWKKQSCRIGEQRREVSIVAKVASRFLNSYLTPTLFLVRGGGGRNEEEDRSNEWDKEEESETRICKYGTFRF